MQNVRQSFYTHQISNKTVELILTFRRRGCKAMNFGLNDDYENVLYTLKKHKNSQFEKVAFIYYNFIGLFESLADNDSIEKTIKRLDRSVNSL